NETQHHHISPCWVSPKQQRAIAFSVISLPVGFHPSNQCWVSPEPQRAIAYLSWLGGGTKPNTTISLPVGF
ncbi:MAG: hypothetical protein P5696_26575, partial [Limnospira sp. PMC 1298.21]|nr:hypothetical protein [Limnospira sp. PMC 1298.21]